MRRILEIHNEGGGGKYLGVPEQFGRKKTEMFQYIVDKVKERTQGWHKSFLSTGGKEVLLKSVAIALPVYSMNVFKLPTGMCEEINSVLAKFWWNTNEERKGMHWFKWKPLCFPKKEGGIGFRDIESFNLALLGKTSMEIVAEFRMSYGSCDERDLLRKGLRFVIGDGKAISAWEDPWLPTHPPRAPKPKNPEKRSYRQKSKDCPDGSIEKQRPTAQSGWPRNARSALGQSHIRPTEVSTEEVEGILFACHSSSYAGHFATYKTVSKVLQAGFWWPTMFKDAHAFISRCDACQRMGNISKRNEMPQNFILEVEVFDVWGIDFMGPSQPLLVTNTF
ncbi:unnamed protein product [Microthlaspi erraticum]|uniref:Integrase zinc-binding domain-containing protein n=1 Tax=Microthlaspi erraticum TaxID=1685480 RepID=A0A6D2K8H4_9BRAS|nr:unnamed protein product [Microthlaspi erraticum]